MSDKFYVYALIDPRDMEIFYIGKGQAYPGIDRGRLSSHLWPSGLKRKNEKNKKIKEILSDGYELVFKKLHTDLNEVDAFNYEREVIENIGLENLTNRVTGGSGCTWSEEQKREKSESMRGKDNHFYGKKHTEEAKAKQGPRGMKHTEEWKKERSKKYEKEGNPMYGKKRPDLVKWNNQRKGKTWEEFYGPEKAAEMKKNRREGIEKAKKRRLKANYEKD